MSAVMRRIFSARNVFDENGWLQIGLAGHQPFIAESYISTGSLYLASTGLLPLGLAADDPFWTGEAKDWTAKIIWSGGESTIDHAI
jgi:hypothetical protein